MRSFVVSIAQLENHIIQQAHEALEEVATETLVQWKGLIKRRVYEQGRLKSDPSNQYYKRTSQLLDSLELNWISPLEVVLDYNTDKILPSMMIDKYSFNRHVSFSGIDWSEAIPHFAELGNGDSKIYSYEGVHAHEDICNTLVKSYSIMLSEALKKRGIPIK